MIPQIRTERLLLRGWRPSDRDAFAVMNRDPEVMEHFPDMLDRRGSDAVVDRIEASFAKNGYGMWAVEISATKMFIGFTGLQPVPVSFQARFTPAVEIGWRLARFAWGHGYATEAARAALRFAFVEAGLPEVVSFTTTTNTRSQALMRRIGMTHRPEYDFDHPRLPEGHPLRRHVLYRLSRTDWSTMDTGSPG